MERCKWANTHHNIYVKYHDEEWGVPVYDDTKLFEFLILESAQAGLSWLTILKRRDGYRKAFAQFNVNKVACFDSGYVEELMQNTDIIRNRRKIQSAINNAKIFIKIQQEFGSFSKYIWSFVKFKPIQNSYNKFEDIPVKTEVSDAISIDLKRRGMSFVGSIIMYAYMQAIGMVNDHEVKCFRYTELNV